MTFDTLPGVPSFPGTKLGMKTELLLSSTWTDISSPYVMERTPGTIGRGQPDEQTQSTPSALALLLNNADSRFSSRNAIGPYYPDIGRNIQVRCSIPEGAGYGRLETDQVSYFSASGVTPITGDFEIQLDVTLDNWYGSYVLASHWNDGSSERSWILLWNALRSMTFIYSPDGSTTHTAFSQVAIAVPPLRRQCLRVTYAHSTGVVTFYTSPPGLSSPTWTQVDQITITSGTLFNSTAAVTLGWCTTATVVTSSGGQTGMNGKIHAAQILQGIGGTAVADPDFTAQSDGTLSFADGASNTWTASGTAACSTRKYLFWGESSGWPQQWNPSLRDVTVSLAGGGILRRLTQGQGHQLLQSALRRYLPGTSGLVAYWPMEDGNNMTGGGGTPVPPLRFASAVAGVPAGTFDEGPPTFASNSNFKCSYALPVLNGAQCQFPIPAHSADTVNQWRFLLEVPSGGEPSGATIATGFTYGTVANWNLEYNTGGYLRLNGFTAANSMLFDTGYLLFGSGVDAAPCWVNIKLSTSGSNVAVVLSVMYDGTSKEIVATATASTASLGNAYLTLVNPSGPLGLTQTAFGQFTYNGLDQGSLSQYALQLAAYNGEPAGTRMARLCAEEGVPFRYIGNLADTTLMGIQTPLDLPSLLQECVVADHGIMWEPRQCFALGYRTRASMQNQQAAITIPFTSLAGQQAGQMTTTEDDQYTVNDEIVSNTYTGGSAEVVVTSGPLSNQPPPNGVGEYQQSTQVNLASDDLCSDLAGWLTWLGTAYQPRYPKIPLNMASPKLASIFYQLCDLELGDRVDISGEPTWLGFDGISQIILQQSSTFTTKTFGIDLTGVPQSPYQTCVFDDPVLAHFDTPGAALAGTMTLVSTTVQVASASDLWTTNAGDFPFDIIVNGERMTVTNITGATNPQTFTVTRGVNGFSKTHAINDPVALFFPPVFGL